jgi:TFIIF-interacting CTD phosphatase-like protein
MSIEHVILDLDHTIIMSITRRRDLPLKQHFFAGYYIYERPHLKEFLAWLAKHFTVSVWTAASRDYGLFIVKNIIEPYIGRRVSVFLFDEHCEKSAEVQGGIIKHLDMLHNLGQFHNIPSFNRHNTVIIDDNEGILAQNNYVIHVKKFTLDPSDRELLSVQKKILAINNK